MAMNAENSCSTEAAVSTISNKPQPRSLKNILGNAVGTKLAGLEHAELGLDDMKRSNQMRPDDAIQRRDPALIHPVDDSAHSALARNQLAAELDRRCSFVEFLKKDARGP